MDKENNQKEESLIRCEKCRRKIEFGERAFSIEEGFIGPRGFVPLAKILLLCSEKCLRNYFPDDNGDYEVEQVPKRIP